MGMVLSTQCSMYWWRELSLFSMKKNLAPAGKEKSRIIPAFRATPMYSSMACNSGAEREYRRPWGSVDQAEGQWHSHMIYENEAN